MMTCMIHLRNKQKKRTLSRRLPVIAVPSFWTKFLILLWRCQKWRMWHNIPTYIYIYIKEFDCIWLHYDLVCGWYFLSYFHKYKTLQMHFACHGTYLRCHWLDTPVCRTSREEIWWSVTSWWFQHMWNMVVKLDDLPGRGKIDHIMYKIVTLQKNTYRICCFL